MFILSKPFLLAELLAEKAQMRQTIIIVTIVFSIVMALVALVWWLVLRRKK